MARVHPETSRVTMENILEETGWGLYYKVLIGIVSACNFCQAVATSALTFALPLGSCDPFINETTILTVDICFFLGRAIGGFLLNSSSDVTGRLWLIPNSLMVMFCSTFLAAFSHSTTTLSVAMFGLGSGVEANERATRIHLAEILPRKTRGCYMNIPNYSWTLGYLAMITSAWKLSQHAVVDHRGTDMRLTAWRLLFAISGGCNIIVACVTALVQPSPRYRLFRKQYNMAQSSLKLFYALNKSKYSETWPLREQDIAGIISDFQINTEPEPLNCTEQIRLLLRRMFKTVCLLFKKRFMKTTLILILMKMLLFTGIIPVHFLLTKAIAAQNGTCEVAGHEIMHLYPPVGPECIMNVDMMLFFLCLLLALNIFGGQIMVCIFVDKIGRLINIVIGSFMCSISVCSLAYWDTNLMFWHDQDIYVKAVLCSLFIIGCTMVHHTVDIIEVEAYPTAARGTAAGVTNFYPNLIICIVCAFWHMSCQVTYVSLGLIAAVSVLVAYFLPELKQHPMVE